MIRTATVVRGHRSLREVRSYLPSNYTATQAEDGTITITGTDRAGWGLDTYVLPRLASGWITAVETTGEQA